MPEPIVVEPEGSTPLIPEPEEILEFRPTRAERKAEKGSNPNAWKVLIAVAAIVFTVATVVLIISIVALLTEPEVAEKPKQTAQQVASDREVDSAPLDALGCTSWTQFQEKATKNAAMWVALAKVRPDISKTDVKELVEAEARGESFIKELPVGTVITNTGLKNGQAFVVTGYVVKKGDTLVLVDKQGVPTVKVSCANPISTSTYAANKPSKPCPEPKPKPKKEEPCPTRNSDPGGKYTPHHPGTATYYNPKAPANPEAPDYDRGNAEEVGDNRGTGEGSTGSSGTGSGGTTPGGSTGEGGGGSTEVANPPTTPPDTTTTEDVTTNPPPPN